MDTITHAVIGVCLGEAIAGKKLGKMAMLWGALANNIPDIDVVTALWMNPADALLAHRGFTHSIFFAVIFSPLIAFVFKKINANKEVSFNKWLLLFGSGIFIHLFIDAFTAYGTAWFEPFSHQRVSFNTLFIIDPAFSFPLLISAIALMVMNVNSPRRKSWMKAGLYISTAYFIAAGVNKLFIDRSIKKSLSSQHISSDKYMSTPTAFNNLLWYVVVDNKVNYQVGYYSIFDSKSAISFETFDKNDSILSQVKDFKEIQKLIFFSDGYYYLNKQSDSIILSDMRFGQDGGWYKKSAPFVFNFNIQQLNSNSMTLQRGRFRSFRWESLVKLYERIKGN